MARTVGIGRQDFEKLRMKNNFYVDKSGFIQEWWESRKPFSAGHRNFG